MRLPALLVGTSGYGLGNRNGSLLFSAAYVARKFHDEYLSVGAAVNPGTARSETQFASAQRVSSVSNPTPVCVATLSAPVLVVWLSFRGSESPNWSTRYLTNSQLAPISASVP